MGNHNHGFDPAAVLQDFNQYTETVFAKYANHAHNAGFVTKEQFVSSHAHTIQSGWEGYQAVKGKTLASWSQQEPNPVTPSEEDLATAAPFIRLVLERMLDLMETEQNWVKGHQELHGKLCILGAIAKAKKELQLEEQRLDAALDAARRQICMTISNFFACNMLKDNGTGIATWNDRPDRTFEEVKLWLKTQLDRIP